MLSPEATVISLPPILIAAGFSATRCASRRAGNHGNSKGERFGRSASSRAQFQSHGMEPYLGYASRSNAVAPTQLIFRFVFIAAPTLGLAEDSIVIDS